MKTLPLFAFAMALSLLPSTAVAAQGQLDPDILVVIESPGDDISGISLVNGYALSKKGSIDYVTWAVDGEDKGFLPYGGSRGDVDAAFPGYADSKDPGFATAWNYNHFTPGEHEIVVRAYDDKGGYNEAKRTFRTARFGDGADKFLKADEIELTHIPIAGLQLYPADATGDRFDVELVWSKAAQQYVIKTIDETCTRCSKLVYAPPTIDSVGSRATGRVDLEWSGGSPVIGYEIERRKNSSVGPESPWVQVGRASGVDPYFVDHPPPFEGQLVPAAAAYEYRVRGLGPSAKSDYSNVGSILYLDVVS